MIKKNHIEVTNPEALTYISKMEMERQKRLDKFFKDRELDREYQQSLYAITERE